MKGNRLALHPSLEQELIQPRRAWVAAENGLRRGRLEPGFAKSGLDRIDDPLLGGVERNLWRETAPAHCVSNRLDRLPAFERRKREGGALAA